MDFTKDYSKKLHLSSVIVMIFILFILLLFATFTHVGTVYAEESSATTLGDYLNTEYGSNISPAENSGITINGDDPIVQYVPKQYFLTEGQQIYVGENYGYYIYTFDDGYYFNEWHSHGNLRSIVLGFEIKYVVDGNASTRDGFKYEINILFQREYLTLLPDGLRVTALGDFEFGGAMESKTSNQFRWTTYVEPRINVNPADGVDVGEGLVTPVPQRVRGDVVYQDVNVFFLNNIAVSANIMNEQDPNAGDEGYNYYKDEGCFLIGTGFDIAAVEHIHNEDDIKGLGIYSAEAITKKLVSTVLSFVPYGEFVGCALDIFEYLIGSQGYTEGDTFEQTNISTYYGTTNIPNSKAAQIELSGGLYKTASVATNSAQNSSLWFGNGHHFIAGFDVSTGTGNNPGWRTVARRIIDVGVTSLLTDVSPVSATSACYSNAFNDYRSKPINEDIVETAYVFPSYGTQNPIDKFVFSSVRNGYYEISTGNSIGLSVVVTEQDSERVCNANESGYYYLNANKNYVVTFKNQTTELKRPTVKVSIPELNGDFGSSHSFTVPAGKETYFALDLPNLFTTISVSGEGAVITGLANDKNSFMETLNATSFDVRSNETNVVRIKNTSAEEQNITLTFSDVGVISTGLNNNVTVNGKMKYFKFVPLIESYNFDYISSSTAINFTLYSATDGGVISSVSDNTVFVSGLSRNKTYWIGLYNASSSDEVSVNIKATPIVSKLSWTVDGEVISGNEIRVYNGKTYNIGLNVNGTTKYVDFYVADQTHMSYVTFDTAIDGNVIINNYNKSIEERISLFSPNIPIIDANDTEFKINLGVVLIIKNLSTYLENNNYLEITDTLSHESDVDVTMRISDPLIQKLNYRLNYEGILGNYEEKGTVDVNGIEDDIFKFTFPFAHLIADRPTITITDIVYDGQEYSFAKIIQAPFNIYLGKGSGTADDPYILNCTQHYLTFALSETLFGGNDRYWRLGADIDISGQSAYVINTFNGHFDGNGFSIIGLEIEIDAISFTQDTTYGWVHENRGTIENLTFKNVTINAPVWHEGAWVFVGTVAGINRGEGVIRNVDIENANISINRNMARIGGIVGVNQGTISDCTVGGHSGDNHVTMFGNGDMGAVCGENTGTISNCVIMATLNHWPSVNNRSIGGVVGYSPSGTISGCKLLLTKIAITGTDANICPNIGSVVGHVTSRTVLEDNIPLVTYDVDALSEAQKIHYGRGSQYGYMEP